MTTAYKCEPLSGRPTTGFLTGGRRAPAKAHGVAGNLVAIRISMNNEHLSNHSHPTLHFPNLFSSTVFPKNLISASKVPNLKTPKFDSNPISTLPNSVLLPDWSTPTPRLLPLVHFSSNGLRFFIVSPLFISISHGSQICLHSGNVSKDSLLTHPHP
jgi:hypothetical protein